MALQFASTTNGSTSHQRNEWLLWTFRWGPGVYLRVDLTQAQIREVDEIVKAAAAEIAWEVTTLREVESLALSPAMEAAARTALSRLSHRGRSELS